MANDFPVIKFRDPATGTFIGFPALKGDKGDTGEKGDTGDKGDTGAKGDTGVPGPNSISTATDISVAGLLKGIDGKVAQAVAGTDYVTPDAMSEVTSQLAANARRIDALQTPATIQNILQNANFASIANWYFTLASGSVSNNEAIFIASAMFGQINQVVTTELVAGHTYYFRAYVKASSNQVKLYLAQASTGNPLSTLIAHTGNGEYVLLEGKFMSSYSGSAIFRVLDYRASGFSEIRVKEAMLTDLTAEYGAGYEPSVNTYKAVIYTYNNSSYFVSTSLAVYLTVDKSYKAPLYVNLALNVLNIISKYNDTQDIRQVFNKKGPNSIFDRSYIYKISNASKDVSTDITAGTAFDSNGTDTFGPYVIAAINNINGDNVAGGFTGGNHGYNGDATGSATGRTASISFFVDGRKVTSFSGFAAFVDVEWVNYVQAHNTKVAAGTGREVVKETYHMHYDGHDLEVRNTIELLELCSIATYYGAQLSVAPWAGYTLFQSAANKTRYVGNVACDAGDKNCDIITHNTGADYADVELDLRHGLGRGTYLSGVKNAFRTNYNKSYFFMIDTPTEFAAGTILSWRGKYRFYSA